MTHLSDEELLDIAEGAGTPPPHLASCERCRRQLADARAILLTLAVDEILPEPSPLFWDHLSARIREAVVAEPAPRGWSMWWRLSAYGGIAAAVVLAAAVWVLRPAPDTQRPIGTASIASDSPRGSSYDMPLSADHVDEPSFAFISDVASEADVDPAIAAGVGAHGADRAVDHLSEPELRALAELLKNEMPNGRVS